MTTIAEALDLAVDNARKTKEARIARGELDGPASLYGYRGADVVAIVQPHRHDGGPIVACAKTMVAGFGLDLLALTIEVYVSEHRRNPTTGERWQPGDMQDLADRDGVAKGWIDDALTVMVYNRAGDNSSITLPFRASIEHGTVQWLDELVGGELGGSLHDALVEAMELQPYSTDVELTALTIGADPEAVTALSDLTTARFLDQHAEVALSAPHGSTRERIFQERGEGEWLK